MLVFDFNLAVTTFNEFGNQFHRTGTIQCDERRDMFDRTDLKFPAQIAHPAGFKLKNAECFRTVQQVVSFPVVEQ